jgi:hypothetical protein
MAICKYLLAFSIGKQILACQGPLSMCGIILLIDLEVLSHIVRKEWQSALSVHEYQILLDFTKTPYIVENSAFALNIVIFISKRKELL